jgi:hypothetical protein
MLIKMSQQRSALVERRSFVREIVVRFQAGWTAEGLKMTEEKVLPLLLHLKMVRPSLWLE